MTATPAEHRDDAALRRFSRTAEIATSDVIRTYSTSFGLATRLLGRRHRQHVRNIYAMVRIADEIVDGVAAEAGLDAGAQAAALDSYIAETHRSMRTGYSSDLILHAFARTARECGIGEELTRPFFDSMRADIAGDSGFTAYDADAHAAYVYGSAEVVGLMCLRVFLRDATRTPAELEILERGARRLGAAFQNVNFLRDLADDTDRLQRGYLGGSARLTDADRDAWVDTVHRQLADARAAIPLLPKDARAAVRSALALFAALTRKVARTPAAELYRRRVRVPDPIKALLAARAVVVTSMERDR
ncbi:squalene/phytoene synthase family protein [Microbacterium sp. p3-SID338]|uniref:phytoene/squalene synthase family protein n=1 Tax=unclassified Microbacterium TaxID=2609290 RepID=UPI000C80C13A|nr:MULTISPECIES: squalene/phytoene synthase family protein [unclassified Microbacterium]MCT1396468.1 squalene/phytoene synthase family protein [Microbacterium sp. p3-SID338]PMC04202.1 phytoene synthase [Microbacterium sp. UMB0228]